MNGNAANYNPRGDGFFKVISAAVAFIVGVPIEKPLIEFSLNWWTGEYEFIPVYLAMGMAYIFPFACCYAFLQRRETNKRLKKGRDIAADAERLRGETFELVGGVATDQVGKFSQPCYHNPNVTNADYETANDDQSPLYVLPPDKA